MMLIVSVYLMNPGIVVKTGTYAAIAEREDE